MKTPDKFAGALSLNPTMVKGGKRTRVWVGVPIVEVACPECGQAVDTPGNQLALRGEPDYKAGTLPGGIGCGHCQTTFNNTTCYFHDDFELAPLTFLALCVLTDENPSVVLSRGFLPCRTQQEGVLIAKGAQVGRNVRFIAPVLVNKGSIIADECEIGPFVSLEDARIEKRGVKLEYCDVRRSMLNRDMAGGVVHDSIIG